MLEGGATMKRFKAIYENLPELMSLEQIDELTSGGVMEKHHTAKTSASRHKHIKLMIGQRYNGNYGVGYIVLTSNDSQYLNINYYTLTNKGIKLFVHKIASETLTIRKMIDEESF